MAEEVNEENEDKKEKWNAYSRQHMNEIRHPEIKLNKRALRDYIIEHGHPPETKIEEIPISFPEQEFNKQLDKILENNYLPIKEKKLKDMLMWDVLDKKGLLSTQKIASILNTGSNWNKPIENIMVQRGYSLIEEAGERAYLFNSQISQK